MLGVGFCTSGLQYDCLFGHSRQTTFVFHIRLSRSRVKPSLHVQTQDTLASGYIVGDLHGCRDLLEIELDRVGFDQSRDRLFSVGDLADRGPDSLGCLRLLLEPWFFAVRGNHEDMMLGYVYEPVMPYESRQNARQFFRCGGGWVENLSLEGEK